MTTATTATTASAATTHATRPAVAAAATAAATVTSTRPAAVPAPSGRTAAPGGPLLTPAVAARELELRRGDFELAVQLGRVRTVPDPAGGHRRVTAREVARLRAAGDFPEGLRERVRTVGTAEGAELMGIAPGRFTRLARAGRLTPVRCYLNRYRAVVWLYLAEELVELAMRQPELLAGRHPEADVAGQDRRPRNWRHRRIALLARATDDEWEHAAAVASALDGALLGDLVPDPHERACLRRLQPETLRVHPDSPIAQGILDTLVLADEPDEIDWYRLRLVEALADARDQCPAPRPLDGPAPAGCTPGPVEPPVPRPPGARPRRGLLGRLSRANRPDRGGRRPGRGS
ncbi:DUF6397 family protein [Streptomyces sp. NPDC048111]|uniref:DUF6397 family protein n=1 Tax=Streptomyces sp. NPDC048111 TaxID=3365500 RepID=UPI00371B05E1